MLACMMFRLSTCILVITSIALAGCGGGDSDSASEKRSATEKDPRAGYFHEEQSNELNPLLADYDTAYNR